MTEQENDVYAGFVLLGIIWFSLLVYFVIEGMYDYAMACIIALTAFGLLNKSINEFSDVPSPE